MSEFRILNKSDGGHTVMGEKILGFTQANVDGKTFRAVRMIQGSHAQSEIIGDFPDGFQALGAVLTEIGKKGDRRWVSVRKS